MEKHPGTSGSLGCAISEAVETASSLEGYRYVLGSVLNQVMLHQSVIGLETKAALDKYNVKPDIIIGCAGGGSNLGGLIAPFMGEKIRGERDYRIIAVEPTSCPSFTRGVFAYDYCDTGMVCPLQKMYTLGSGFMPASSHAGGLRYHGMSSVVSQLYDDGLMEAGRKAMADLAPAVCYVGATQTERMNFNRHNKMADGSLDRNAVHASLTIFIKAEIFIECIFVHIDRCDFIDFTESWNSACMVIVTMADYQFLHFLQIDVHLFSVSYKQIRSTCIKQYFSAMSFDIYGKIGLCLLLTGVIGKQLGPQADFAGILRRVSGRNQGRVQILREL